jgi:uncharacterized protein (UPF0261 family)
MARNTAYVVGTFDTKGDELRYVGDLLRAAGCKVALVDVGTRSDATDVALTALAVAAHHPDGAGAVLGGEDRGHAVDAMSIALARCLPARADLAGVIGLGGSGGTVIVSAALRALPIGIPKLLVSTLAAGDVRPFVDVSDIAMLFPVTDIGGLNRISRVVLGNAAHALAGMVLHRVPVVADGRPALGVTMFGVTTPCVQALTAELGKTFDCQVFHANGPGGRAMEALAAAGLLRGIVDVTTTEVADQLLGGVCGAGPHRLDVLAGSAIPWVGSVGALDMVNFWAAETVPERYRGRRLHAHNASVTLMRTTAEECTEIGTWIARKLNAARGPVILLLPEGGVSAMDAPGMAFHDPAATAALFAALEVTLAPAPGRRIERVPCHINDPLFADALAGTVRSLQLV